MVFHCCLHTPVVALLAELLLEVTQGQAVALHGPPVRDLLTAEEICHHRLTTAHPAASYALFTLLRPARRRRGRKEGVLAGVCTLCHTFKKSSDQKSNQKQSANHESTTMCAEDSTKLVTVTGCLQ